MTLKTVYMAGPKPDDDEVLSLRQAYEALLGAARAVDAAAYDELTLVSRKLRAA